MFVINPHPILWEGGSVTLYTHGVLFALGAEAAYLVSERLAKRANLDRSRLPVLALLIFIAGLLGARVGFFLAYPSAYRSLADVASFWQGGLLSYTGIVTGALAGYLYARTYYKQDWQRWRDILVIAALFGWSIGRWGNFFAGDSYGVPSAFWQALYGRVPIQLFESLGVFALGTYLYGVYQGTVRGWSVWAMALYGYLSLRFVIDAWRDEPYIFSHLRASQLVSLAGIAALSAILYAANRRAVTKRG